MSPNKHFTICKFANGFIKTFIQKYVTTENQFMTKSINISCCSVPIYESHYMRRDLYTQYKLKYKNPVLYTKTPAKKLNMQIRLNADILLKEELNAHHANAYFAYKPKSADKETFKYVPQRKKKQLHSTYSNTYPHRI